MLLRKLLDATSRGGVKWGETSDQSSFRVGLGGGMLRLSEHPDGYSVAFLNPEGREVDRVTDDETEVSLRDLYAVARRSALAVDTLIESMALDLTLGKVVTPPPEPPDTSGSDIPF